MGSERQGRLAFRSDRCSAPSVACCEVPKNRASPYRPRCKCGTDPLLEGGEWGEPVPAERHAWEGVAPVRIPYSLSSGAFARVPVGQFRPMLRQAQSQSSALQSGRVDCDCSKFVQSSNPAPSGKADATTAPVITACPAFPDSVVAFRSAAPTDAPALRGTERNDGSRALECNGFTSGW